ncbi:helix-turn-helix transcriptional regulator [Microbaculum marinisediminis]|uniref:AlpA family phage regulatory protein n=1 Tax=Microbaculum marinisediminis TaxID=2931392 RepID=A0AAW5R0C5_9HYPH|nr:AlpA family phage regulatory protein [Microbaculum sp. A6E488]MCT8973254.1 AlpA family phage regulatory protein [Microbaculum sp. A6E488]
MILLSWDDLRGKGITYSRSQLYRKIKDGTFPKPVPLGENRTAFVASEIDRWIEGRIAARDAADTAAA